MPNNQDDISVIARVLQGQQGAYTILVDRYQSYVFTLVLRYVPQREQAEELAQDVFVKAYRFLADFKGNSKFSTWLYTIVNTTCLSHLRKRQDEAVLMSDLSATNYGENIGSGESAGDRMEQKTQKQLVDMAIKKLPGDDARIISLFYLAEQSVEEIALVMGLTTANVKVKLFRGRQKLREVMTTSYKNEAVL
jgi:RNA polymerase sigma-70 factor (ECF subfamily)